MQKIYAETYCLCRNYAELQTVTRKFKQKITVYAENLCRNFQMGLVRESLKESLKHFLWFVHLRDPDPLHFKGFPLKWGGTN